MMDVSCATDFDFGIQTILSSPFLFVCVFVFRLAVCCRHGEGGPVQLFDGPIEDYNLLMEHDFEDIGRYSYSFVLEGYGTSSAPAAGLLGTLVSFVVTVWMLQGY